MNWHFHRIRELKLYAKADGVFLEGALRCSQLPRLFPNLNVLTLRVSISPKDEYLTATHMHPAHVVKPQNGARTLRRPSPTTRL